MSFPSASTPRAVSPRTRGMCLGTASVCGRANCCIAAKDKADKVFMELKRRQVEKQPPSITRDVQLRGVLGAAGHSWATSTSLDM